MFPQSSFTSFFKFCMCLLVYSHDCLAVRLKTNCSNIANCFEDFDRRHTWVRRKVKSTTVFELTILCLTERTMVCFGSFLCQMIFPVNSLANFTATFVKYIHIIYLLCNKVSWTICDLAVLQKWNSIRVYTDSAEKASCITNLNLG